MPASPSKPARATTRTAATTKVAKKAPAKKAAAKKAAAKKAPVKKAAAKKAAAKKAPVKKVPAKQVARPGALAVGPTGEFVALAGLQGATEAALAAVLDAAPWQHFHAARDLPPLRAALLDLEARAGITALHRRCTARLRGRMRLVHGLVHEVAVSAIGLSPDGRYLATGSFCGDDYERGGTLQIWEVERGRCVHVLDRIRGGVGWPGYGDQIQWSPDGRWLGVGYDTNVVGVLDPFAVDASPRTVIHATQGWDTPPAWCWSPDGTSIAIACWSWHQALTIPIVIAALRPGEIGDAELTAMRPELPAALAEALGAGNLLQPMERPRWCADGLIRGHNRHGQAFAVDVAARAIAWHGAAHPPVTWSPDGRLFAQSPAGLAIYDAGTGLPTGALPLFVGAREHVWAPDSRRLAMIVEGDNEFGAEPGTHVLDEGRHVVSLDQVPRRAKWDESDFRGLAFSPDGARLVMIEADADEEDTGRISAWALEPGAARKLWAQTCAGASGLVWGAGDTLVVVGAETLVFLDAASGAPRGRHPIRPEPAEDSPLTIAGRDLGAGLVPSPLLPVDVAGERRWAIAFAEGPIVCPREALAQLDERLCLSVDRRFAWPLRWGEVAVYADLAAAADDPALPIPRAPLQKLARTRATPAGARAWPPEQAGELVDLLRAHWGWIKEIGGWSTASAQLAYLARIHARLGNVDEALACAAQVGPVERRIQVEASIAVDLAAAGELAAARIAAGQAQLDGEETDFAHERSRTEASLAAAHEVLGDAAVAARLFAEAEAHLFPETNAFQHVGHLAGLHARLGRLDRALEILGRGPWDQRPIADFLAGTLAACAWRGANAQVDAFLDRYFAGESWGAEVMLEACVGVALARGEHAEALRRLARFERLSTDDLEERAIRGLWDAGERAAAWAELERRLAVDSGPEGAAWLAFAAALDPSRAAAATRGCLAAAAARVPKDTSILAALASAAGRVGAGAEVLGLAPQVDVAGRLALAGGVLADSRDPAAREQAGRVATAALAAVKSGQREAVAAFAAAAIRGGAAELAAQALERSFGFAVGHEVRWALSGVIRAMVEVGALAEARRAWSRLPKAIRIYEVQPLLDACVRRGAFAAAIELLSELPHRTMSDRCNVSIAAIATAARARWPGFGDSLY